MPAYDVLKEFYKDNRRTLIAFASNYVGPHNAEDVVQDSFVKALLKYSSFNPNRSMFTWVTQIVKNTSLDRIRASKSCQKYTEPLCSYHKDLEAPAEQEYDPNLKKIQKNQILDNLDVLRSSERLAVLFVINDDYELEGIAELLCKSQGAIKRTLTMAAKKIRSALNEECD